MSNYSCIELCALIFRAICEGGFDLQSLGCCDTPSLQRVSSTNSFGVHPRFVLTHHMAAKKKGNDNTSTEPPTSLENAIVPSANAVNREDASVDYVAEGEFEVELHDLGIPPEDIKAVRRIEVRLAERSRNARQAVAQACPSAAQVTTRAKGK